MQSSFWKLLTAAGIIGLGTLGVLEVQHRLSKRNAVAAPDSSVAAADAATSGTEKSVVPDDTTDFDRLMASSEPFAGLDEPETDTATQSAVNDEASVAAADNSRFYGADAIDQTVKKDELSDEANPFSFDALSEPESDNKVTSASGSNTNAGISSSSASDSTTPGIDVSPASFQSDSGSGAPGKAAAEEVTEPEITLPANDVASEIPFAIESEPSADASAAVGSIKEADSAAGMKSDDSSRSGDTPDAMIFFNADAERTDKTAIDANTSASPASPVANDPPTSPSSRSKVMTPAAPAGEEPSTFAPDRTPSSTSQPERESPSQPKSQPRTQPRSQERTQPRAANNSQARAIQQTAMTQDEDGAVPDMFLPEPIPDVTREPAEPAIDFDRERTEPDDNASPSFDRDRNDNVREFEAEPFTEDPAAANPSTPRDRSNGTRSEFPVRDNSARDRNAMDEPFGGPDDQPRTFDDSRDNDPTTLPVANEPLLPREPGRGLNPSANAATVSETMRPNLIVRKDAPEKATVGVSHEYTIIVENDGDSPALDVIVEDELGTAADVVDSRPAAEYDQRTGVLSWTIAELGPREREEFRVRITPTGEGTIDGVATVRFKAQVKSATVITSPKLQVDVTGPSEVKVGDEVNLRYTVRNNGSGDASAVILRSVLPPGFRHPEGGDLEYEIERLRAGDEESVELTVVAAEPGNNLRVAAEVSASGVSADEQSLSLTVVGAQLTLERLGPERRFVGRSAKYQNIVRNETNFNAANAVVIEQIPDGMKFLSATEGGQYSPDSRHVQWDIVELRSGGQQILEIELVAESSGQMESIVEVTEAAGFRTRATENTVVTVEDIHNVTADISRLDAPVQIGQRFGFTITVDNRGTAAAKNVELAVEVPPEIKVLAAGTRDVPGKLMRNNVVRYSNVVSIPPGETMSFQVTLQGQQAVRNAPVVALLKSDEMTEALSVSESVTVYDDQP